MLEKNKKGKKPKKNQKIQQVPGKKRVAITHVFSSAEEKRGRGKGIGNLRIDESSLYKKTFRNATDLNIRIFHKISGSGNRDVIYLGKTVFIGLYNTETGFFVSAQNRNGSAGSRENGAFFFDVTECLFARPDVIFLDKNFSPLVSFDCVEVKNDNRWGNDKQEKKFLAEESLFVYRLDGSMEKFSLEKDERFSSGGYLVKIKKILPDNEDYQKILKAVTGV